MGAGDHIIWTDKSGCTYKIGSGTIEDRSALLAMYDCISATGVFQGLPPVDPGVRSRWVTRMLEQGENVLAWSEDHVRGHACLLPDWKRLDAEFLIFVSRDFRNRGLGTRLTTTAVARATELGLKDIWLTVETLNFRAIRVYKKCGFVFCEDCDDERVMILRP